MTKHPFTPDPRAPDAFLYHYTSTSTFLDYILPNQTIRFSPMSEVNDPKESSFWCNVRGKSDQETVSELADRLRKFFPSRVKVACFARDDSSIAFRALRHIFHGWAKPAMWAHYGANHTGVCLALERQALLRTFNIQFSHSLRRFHGNVNYHELKAFSTEYMEERYRLHQPNFEIDDFEASSDTIALRYLDKYHEEMYFRKHGDWSNENEYRLLVASPEAGFEYMSISDSIVGVCAGLELEDSVRNDVKDACDRLGIAFTEIDGGIFR